MSKLRKELRVSRHRSLWCLADKKLSGFCPVGFSTVTLLPDGTVLPCRRLPIKIGDIKKESLFKIWYTSEILWKLRKREDIKKWVNVNIEINVLGVEQFHMHIMETIWLQIHNVGRNKIVFP